VEEELFTATEPIDILAKIPTTFAESIASTKWKERKDALDAFYASANVPRIVDGNYSETADLFAKCMKDANIAVVTVAAQCITVLANGLRSNFSRYRSAVLQPILEKLKERKQSVVDALAAALDAIFNAV